MRGNLASENILRIEGPDDGDSATTPARLEMTGAELESGWQEKTIAVPSADFQSVKTFFTVSIQYSQPPRTTTPGGGGTVYLDDIRYE